MNLDDLRITTPRLLLRVPRLDDLDPWAEMMSDEETARFIGGVMPRAALLARVDDDDRRVARDGNLDVLGHREGDRPLGGTPRAVDTGRVAWPGSRLGPRARLLGTRVRHGRRRRRDRLGVRSPWVGPRHPQHQPRERRLSGRGPEAGLTKPGPGGAAAARIRTRGSTSGASRATSGVRARADDRPSAGHRSDSHRRCALRARKASTAFLASRQLKSRNCATESIGAAARSATPIS